MPSPGCESHSDTTLYISLVIIYTKQTGGRQNGYSDRPRQGAPVGLARAAAARLVAGGCGGPEELQRTQKAIPLIPYKKVF